MSRSPARIAAVTLALLVAGAIFGGLAAAIAFTIGGALTEAGLPPLGLLAFVASVGAVLGAPLLPLTSWLLLRRVPLGLSWLGTTAGTVLGGCLGWFASYHVRANSMIICIEGAVAGFAVAVIVLRLRFSRPAEARVAVSRSAV